MGLGTWKSCTKFPGYLPQRQSYSYSIIFAISFMSVLYKTLLYVQPKCQWFVWEDLFPVKSDSLDYSYIFIVIGLISFCDVGRLTFLLEFGSSNLSSLSFQTSLVFQNLLLLEELKDFANFLGFFCGNNSICWMKTFFLRKLSILMAWKVFLFHLLWINNFHLSKCRTEINMAISCTINNSTTSI